MKCCQMVSLPRSLGLTVLAYLDKAIWNHESLSCFSCSTHMALIADSKRANYQRYGRSGGASTSGRYRSQSSASAGYDPFARSDWSYSTPRRRPRGAQVLSHRLQKVPPHAAGQLACMVKQTSCTASKM